jgi:pimeloyl-ACP methyl ester carboxylesterase
MAFVTSKHADDARRPPVPEHPMKEPVPMTTFAFIHGAGDVGWYWHLVEEELRGRGHNTVAPDLPVEDDAAGLSRYADVVIDAIGDRQGVVIVAQSFGGYVAPIVAERIEASMIVLVAGMIPKPAESAEDMFRVTGWQPQSGGDPSEQAVFYHDVPETLAKEAMSRGRRQSDTPGSEPWPLAVWPDIPTRFIAGRDDRFFPIDWLRRVVRDRLGITPDEIDSGHCPALSRPRELANLLEGYRATAPHKSEQKQSR